MNEGEPLVTKRSVALATAVLEFLPWAASLPALDRNAFLLDLADGVERVSYTIQAWRRTAAIRADPRLVPSLTPPVPELSVPRRRRKRSNG